MADAFGPFGLSRLLGRGGMAEAYLAFRLSDAARRPLVLKRIRPDLAHEEEYFKRFVLEAQVASRLSHPNLVRFLEFGRVGACHYICMEYVRGYSLHRLMERVFSTKQPPSLPAALSLGVGIFDGLSVMHGVRDEHDRARPMLHRDVTPSNVIVARDGRPVIIDFGIAKDVFGPAITLPGRVIGTARYMAPEHRRAEFIDPRADVFSASVILFELLTGRHPWPTLDPIKELLRTTFDAPEITPEVRARIPEDVEEVLVKGLSCEPEGRWHDAKAASDALRSTMTWGTVGPLGVQAVHHWLSDEQVGEDEELGEPVLDHSNAEVEVMWTADGALMNPRSDRLDDSDSESRVLSIPPLPPRRDAVLGLPDTGDIVGSAAPRPMSGWRFGVAIFGLALLAVLAIWGLTR